MAEVAVRTCSVEGCESTKVLAKKMCAKHYARQRKYGTTDDNALQRTPNAGPCSVNGCENPMRKRTWCAAHYAQWKRIGEVKPFSYKWATERRCIVCGKSGTEHGRKFCSDRCNSIYRRDPEAALTLSRQCAKCMAVIDLRTVSAKGHKKRFDSMLCHGCRRGPGSKPKTNFKTLAERDGLQCGICDETVDMDLKFPDPFSPSVDHIIPSSRGGTHDPENLQLAHLWCNWIKNTQVGFKI